MDPVPVWLQDVGDGVIWAATVMVIVWVLQYTMASPWWHDPVGRTVVTKDIALLFLLVPSCIIMAFPHLLTPLAAELLGIFALSGVALVMFWRCVVWYRLKPFSRWYLVRKLRRPLPDDMNGQSVSTHGEDSAL